MWAETDLDEVVIGTGHGGVSGSGEDVLVVLGVDEHAEAQVLLRWVPVGSILVFQSLISVYPQHCFNIHPLHWMRHGSQK